MALDFKFPDVGEGITEGEIVTWRVKEGDAVAQDEVIAEIETDKAVVEIPSPQAGTILKIHHQEGDTIKVGEVLVTIGDAGEKPASKKEPPPEARPKEAPKPPKKKESFGVVGDIPETLEMPKKPLPPAPAKAAAHELAMPAVRRLAKGLGVDLSQIQGTGNGGRITEDDVRKAAPKKKESKAAKVTKKYDMWGYVDRVPLKGIRKATAKHMIDAVQSMALVSSSDDVDVTRLWELRKQEKDKAQAGGVHLTFMPFVVKGVITALKSHPYLNASLDQEHEEILIKKYYNIGIAVDMDGGLIVPVIKGADQKSILQLGKEIQDLAAKARDRKIDLADLKGGTFTITNYGAVGGLYATPIPNYPEVAILGTGRIIDKPVVVDGEIQVRKILPLSLTFDHRVLDGAEAQRFVNDLKAHLEYPNLFILEK